MVDGSGVRSSVQVADLRKYGVLSSMKRWAWEKMKVESFNDWGVGDVANLLSPFWEEITRK